MNATITKIELVNGGMLSFTLELPNGKSIEDFCLDDSIGGILNCTLTKTGVAIVNSWHQETDLKVGDEITTSGEVIDNGGSPAIEQATTPKRQTPDYRDVYNAKHFEN